MQFLIYCDFSTLTCDEKQFAEALSFPTAQFLNLHQGKIWLLELPEFTPGDIPYASTCEDIFIELRKFTTKDSTLIISKVSDTFGFLMGDSIDPIFKE